MKKQGFTLIELMVVIVIMGILAAVAVPKLFGMIAKSKASEVPTAVGTWINLQDAYVAEKNVVGNWVQIGYEAPGTVNTTKTASETGVIKYAEGGDADGGYTWTATPKANLNDCTTSMKWSLIATGSSTGLTIAENGTSTLCQALTASWENLYRGSSAGN